jgi:hypothetical protein
MRPHALNIADWTGITRSPRPVILSSAPSHDPFEIDSWVEAKRPAWLQSASSCGGHATANAIEDIVLKHQGRGALSDREQIDGDLIWREVRKRRYNGDMDGGVQLHEPLEVAVEIGLLPPSTVIRSVDANLGSVAVALREAPIVQGTCIHDGWKYPHKANGCIPEKYIPNPWAGHATEICGVRHIDGVWFVLFFNSWGAQWGWNGYGLLPVWQWQQALLAQPLQFLVDPADMSGWSGWRKAVVEK